MFEITITADCNDADYLHETNDVSQETIHTVIKPALALIEQTTEWNSHNFGTGDQRDHWRDRYPKEHHDLLEHFSEYAPHNEFGIHTIESVRIIPKIEPVYVWRAPPCIHPSQL